MNAMRLKVVAGYASRGHQCKKASQWTVFIRTENVSFLTEIAQKVGQKLAEQFQT